MFDCQYFFVSMLVKVLTDEPIKDGERTPKSTQEAPAQVTIFRHDV